MANGYFPMIRTPIAYEGPDSDNPLAFKWYQANRLVAGKPMREHLKFAVAYWHTFLGTGADPFGDGAYNRPWRQGADSLDVARRTLDAAFEFFGKLGVEYWCFHDRDLAPEGNTPAESERNVHTLVQQAKTLQQHSGIRLLWGTANLFSHARYTHGASTNPDPRVFAFAAHQVQHAIDATLELGGTGYVFWGGREGYSSLLNTDMAQEQRQMATFLRLARDYARSRGFTGALLIEPKPKEPSSHQYDVDAATVLGFLQRFDLLDDFSLNIEANHATLAGHSFEHDLLVAHQAGKLGSIDINRGNPLLGWDTDQFPTSLHDAVWANLLLLKQGGLRHGGLNFDAKVRRGSCDLEDLFYAHIGGMDTFARGLLIAERIQRDGQLDAVLATRYALWREGFGADILAGRLSLDRIAAQAEREPPRRSGQEERLENLWNRYLFAHDIV